MCLFGLVAREGTPIPLTHSLTNNTNSVAGPVGTLCLVCGGADHDDGMGCDRRDRAAGELKGAFFESTRLNPRVCTLCMCVHGRPAHLPTHASYIM